MPRRPRPSLPRQRGAALLLLVVLASLGAASLMMSVFSGERSDDPARARATQRTLGEAREALLGFAMTHGRLPRPAVSALDGQEAAEPCASDAECTGFLPWVALGIAPDDGWGRRLRYSVTPVYTREPVLARFAIADKTVVSRDPAGQPVYRLGHADCAVSAPCAPAVVYSTGKQAPGTSAQGIALANPSRTNTDEQHNYVTVNNFIARPASLDPAQPGGEFDDLVVWLPLRQLYLRMNVAGVLP